MEAPVREGEILAGKYRVERVLGRGGMGVVVAARHVDLDDLVALKFLLPEALSDPDSVTRFLKEARASVRIKSEHVARVHDVGTLESGAPYIVMEYLEGSDLAAVLRNRGPCAVEDAVDYLAQACEAMAGAHSMGIVHRDLKPSNLMLVHRSDGSECVKVLDFGISKVLHDGGTSSSNRMTRSLTLLGSPSYMSPEQMMSTRDVDARTDIWALGAILYELLTGQRPYVLNRGSPSLRDDLLATSVTPPSRVAFSDGAIAARSTSVSNLQRRLRGELDAIVARAMAKVVDDRYPSVDALGDDLAREAKRREDQHLVHRRDRAQVLRLPEDDLRHRRLARLGHRLAQESIGSLPPLAGLQVIRRLEVARVDGAGRNEGEDVDGLRTIERGPLEILRREHGVLALADLVALHHLGPGHHLALALADPLVVHRRLVLGVQQVKVGALAPHRAVKPNRNVDQPE